MKSHRWLSRTLLAAVIAISYCISETDNFAQTFTDQNATVDAAMLRDFETAKRTFKRFKVESVEEFARMKAYRANLLLQGKVTHRFTLADGKLIQCIAVGTQPSVAGSGGDRHVIPTAPSILPRGSANSTQTPSSPPDFGMDGTVDSDGHVRKCPVGSIPMWIPSLEDLCRFRNLQDRMRKYPGTITQSPHEYAHAYKVIDNQGEQADFNVWKPFVERTDEFSLSQLWVTNGAGDDLQTAETGWQVFTQLYGDSEPHLFIYTTTHNYKEGYPGGYNLDMGLFVQTDSSIIIGGSLRNYVSTYGGNQYSVTLMFYHDPGTPNWWLQFGTTWVGYYPNTLYDSAGIAVKASEIDYGGEIVNHQIGGIHTATDMGSGHFASEGFGYSAFVKHIRYIDTAHFTQEASGLFTNATNTSYYDIILHSSGDPNYVNYFYFGGPGGSGGGSARADFNFDGKTDDALFNAATRRTALWYLNNNVFIGSAYGPTAPAGWRLVDVADFNQDGSPDYLLVNSATLQTAIWYLSGATLIGTAYGPTGVAGWTLMAAADFNNDGSPDYVFYNSVTRQTAIWYLYNNVFAGSVYGPTLVAGWQLSAAVDFDFDDQTDLALFNPATRQTAIWYLSGSTLVSTAYGPTVTAGYQLVGAADFNGDVCTDYILYNPSSRRTALWYLTNNLLLSTAYGPTLVAGYSLAAP